MEKPDIVIVGAGIAGLTAGIHLRKRNLSVLIIDKAVFPRKKLCGGFLTYPAIREIAALGFDCTDGSVFYPSSDVYIHHQGRELKMQLTRDAYLVDRFRFDHLLYKKFKELGGEVLEGTRATRIANANTLILDNGNSIHFDILIGADGANSIVRKYLNKENSRHSDGFCVGKNYSLPIPSHLPLGFHLYMDLIDEGYGWCFAYADRYASVGVGGTKKDGMVLAAAKQLFARLVVDEPHLEGAIIPNGKPANNLASKNIFLAGDATGLVDRVLGEGIYPALLSGRIIGSKLGAGLTANTYRKELQELIEICQSARLLGKLMADRNIKDMLVRKGFSHPQFLKYLCEEIVLKKNQHYSQVLPLYLRGRKKLSVRS